MNRVIGVLAFLTLGLVSFGGAGVSASLVLHSDGLTDKWDLGDYPGLTGHAPVVIAATLLRDAARRRDDAAILVARAS